MMPDETPTPPEVPVSSVPIPMSVETPAPEVPVTETIPPVETPPAPPVRSLRDQWKAEFERRIEADPTILKVRRQIAKHRDEIKAVKNEIYLAEAVITAQKKWLREETTEAIRKETGLERIIGLDVESRPKNQRFKDTAFGKMIAAREAARKALRAAERQAEQAVQATPPPTP